MTRFPQGVDSLLRRERVRVVDVGARGGWPRKWQTMRPWVTLVGFEPEAHEWERLRNSAEADEVYLADALYRSNSEILLHHTRDPHCTSLYRPNQALIQRLRPGDDRLEVVRSETIPVTTLDHALEGAGIQSVDFLKLDTQGSELDILQGGVRTLEEGVIGVEVEVEFLPLYEGQPLFPDVHQFMVSHGFELMDFPHTCSVADFRAAAEPARSQPAANPASRWLRSRFAPPGKYRGAKQLLYGDAIYLRPADHVQDRMRTDTPAADLLLARAVAVSCATSFFDHAWNLVEMAHRQALINDGLSKDLRLVIRSLSNSLPRLAEDAKRLARRIRHRMRHAGE